MLGVAVEACQSGDATGARPAMMLGCGQKDLRDLASTATKDLGDSHGGSTRCNASGWNATSIRDGLL